MPTRFVPAMVALIALSLGRPAMASPITYAFAGNLDSAFNGATGFDGTFTINGDPPGGPFSDQNSESPVPVSISLNIGGQTINFPELANPTSYGSFASFQNNHLPPWFPGKYFYMDEASLIGNSYIPVNNPSNPPGESGYAAIKFAMSLYADTASNDLANLRGLSKHILGANVEFAYPLGFDQPPGFNSPIGEFFSTGGTITSVELLPDPPPVPEPTTLAIFSIMSAATIAYRWTKQRGLSTTRG